MTIDRPIRRVLCGTDFSAGAASALEWAADVAGRQGAELHVAHVWEIPEYLVPPELMGSAGDAAARIEAEVRAQMAEVVKGRGVAATHLPRGMPDVELARLCERLGADLLVVGTEGRHGLPHVLLGSVAERVVRLSPAPVATIPRTWTGRRDVRTGPSRILVPCDLAGGSERVVPAAIALASELSAEVDLLHVVEPPAYVLRHPDVLPEAERAARARLAELAAAARPGVVTHVHVRHGAPGEAIVALARELDADLVVLPTHGRRGAARFFLGSVAERVARTAGRPVLTARGFHEGEPGGS